MARSAITHVKVDLTWIADFCKRHHVQRLALFGSVLRDDFRATSDVDVLIDLDPDVRVGFIGLAKMEQELSEVIGRTVDLRTPAELSWYFRQRVLNSAEVLYER